MSGYDQLVMRVVGVNGPVDVKVPESMGVTCGTAIIFEKDGEYHVSIHNGRTIVTKEDWEKKIKVVNAGNCMMCGKPIEVDESEAFPNIFFCKECSENVKKKVQKADMRGTDNET